MLCVASSVRTPNTSLHTLPVGYFGGVATQRPTANIEMLSKMRIIVIEKWEGPCWNKCYDNDTHTPPLPCSSSCDVERYMMGTIQKVKQLNPEVAAVFYLNTLYDFPFYSLHGMYEASDADMKDINGKVIGLRNDNGMYPVPVYDFGKIEALDIYLDFHTNLSASGIVDGTFPDKHNVFAWKNGSNWQICESGEKTSVKNWSKSCAVISETVALKHNKGKQSVLDGIYKIYGKSGVLFLNTTQFPHLHQEDMTLKALQKFIKLIADTLKDVPFVYVQVQDQGSSSDPSIIQSVCKKNTVAVFLLAVERGAVIGCNGWDEQFEKPLGDPLGPARVEGDVVSRNFTSGTWVSYNAGTNEANIHWAH